MLNKKYTEGYIIIDIMPTRKYYSDKLKCYRLSQMIGVQDSDGNKFYVNLYPPFSSNSFDLGDRVKIWMQRQYTTTFAEYNKTITYYQATSCEPVQTSSPIPYATYGQLQSLSEGTLSWANLTKQYNEWQKIISRTNNYLITKEQSKVKALQEQLFQNSLQEKRQNICKMKNYFQINII